MTKAENINVKILEWARETSGLTIEDAAIKIGLTSTKKVSAVDKLMSMETGDLKPTREQLVKIAKTYKRPLTVFYRNAPPKVGDRGEDFRANITEISNEQAGRLDALLRDIKARQGMVRSIIEGDDDNVELSYVGKTSIKNPVQDTVAKVRNLLEIDEVTVPGSGKRSPDDLFKDLREKLERIGVFVLLAGNLGSYHTNISLDVFRGFAIADSYAPFIVINDQDAKAARSFTLIHEFTHILIGSTGVSGAPSTVMDTAPSAIVEKYCNDVAGEFLLPASTLSSITRIVDIDEALGVTAHLANQFNVSEPMAAYRLMRVKHLSKALYRELVSIYYARWSRERQKAKEDKTDSTGPSYYTVRKHKLGDALIDVVGRTLREGELTHTKAAKVLGVKPHSVEPLIQQLSMTSGVS